MDFDLNDARKQWMIDNVGGVRMPLNATGLDVPLPINSGILQGFEPSDRLIFGDVGR